MQLKINLSGRRSLLACFSKAKSKGRTPCKNWIVFLPESGAEFQEGRRQDLRELLGARMAAQFNYLVINKPGVSSSGVNQHAFELSFRRPKRVRDAVTAMKKVIPPDHQIFLVGYSEGAYLAPQVARLDSRIAGAVMIGGGTRGWLKEELSNAGPREKRGLRRKIQEIADHPRSLKKWNSFSFATWHSYSEDNTLEALDQLRIPVLAILGKRDRTIDYQTTWQDLKKRALRKKIMVRVFSDCGHSFVNHWADAWYEIRKFLELFE